MPRALDLTGQVFGHLTVLGRDGHNAGNIMWKARCICGHIRKFRAYQLKNGTYSDCNRASHYKRIAKVPTTPPSLPIREVCPPGFPEDVRALLKTVRETDARHHIMFGMVRNFMVDVENLYSSVKTLCATLVELLDQPQSCTHAQAILQDFVRKNFQDTRGRQIES